MKGFDRRMHYNACGKVTHRRRTLDVAADGTGGVLVAETQALDALGHATAYGHDALGRRMSVTGPLANAVTTAYDAEGRRIAVTRSGTAFGDLSGATDLYACNARGEVTGARRTKGGAAAAGSAFARRFFASSEVCEKWS